MEDTIILYPSPGISHLVSMVELGKLILNHQPSFSIIILMTTAPYYNTGSTSPYIRHVSATTPSIIFHHLPPISIQSPISSFSLIEDVIFELPRLNNLNLHQTLQTISQKSKIKAFIIDFFCNSAFQVSVNLDIPTFYFYTSGASDLSVFLYLPTIHESTTESIEDMKNNLELPGIPPISPLDLPKMYSNRNSSSYRSSLDTGINMAKSSGIIINTFESFEPRAIKAISDGLCIPNARTPPIYCIGPLIAGGDGDGYSGGGDELECLSWLNSQPSQSVVFLCFGSRGCFKEEQIKEIAIGLENSGYRFLWVVRSPPTDDESKRFLAPPEPDVDVLLPKGFLERTKDRGLVLKSWAPQVAVLSHDSVGGFVTHCGWNSVLEAVCVGVPMVAWPLYAEQKLNKVVLVEEIRIALGLEEGFVEAAELEKRVRELMDSERGKEVRNRVRVMRDCAKGAVGEGGSSRVVMGKLVELWKKE